MKTLSIMSLDFTYKAAIKGYESIIVNRTWNSIGSMILYIGNHIANADLIAEDDLMWFDKEYEKVHIVERIQEVFENGVMQYEIKVSHINTLLKDYITIPPSGQAYDRLTGTREDIVRSWVNSNCINPSDTNRKQYPIILGSIQGLGTNITEQTRNKNLSDELVRILSPDNLGWCLVLDPENKKFVFNVESGTDLTAGQSLNNRVMFGLKYGNMANYKKVRDSQAEKTVAYVGGQGEGAARTIVKVESTGYTRRKEKFVDARDIDDTGELTERGHQTLSELAAINSYEFEVLDRQYVYETDWNLGDFVTVVVDKDNYIDLQIQKVKEVYESGNISVIPEFGKPERTLGGIIKSVTERVAGIETSESSDSAIGIADHGELEGLDGDDHTQYHNDERGDHRYYTQTQINTSLFLKSNTTHNHKLADLEERSFNSLVDKPLSLPANGGNADTVDNKHASDFADADHTHSVVNSPMTLGSGGSAEILQNSGGWWQKLLFTDTSDTAVHWFQLLLRKGIDPFIEMFGIDGNGNLYAQGNKKIYHEGNPPPPSETSPAGAITQFAGLSIPSGWLDCNGQAVSRSTYSNLYSSIGTVYGTGDGSTTFNLPDLKGRIPVGLDGTIASFNTMGKTGGEAAHTLTIDEMPAHTHQLYGDNDSGPDGGDTIATDDVPDTSLESGSCGSTGGDQSHNNLQPYIVMKYIIKI